MYIVGGANGSGKSTLIGELSQERRLEVVNADDIARELNPEDMASVQLQAGRIFFQNINRLIEDRESFIIETTLSGKYSRKIIKRLQKAGCKIKLIYIFLETPLLSIERIKVRVLGGGHHVADDDVLRRYSRSIANFWNDYRFLVDSWELYNNSGKAFRPIAIGREADCIVLDYQMYEMFQEELA